MKLNRQILSEKSEGLSNFTEIDWGCNKVTQIEKETFKGLTNLTTIYREKV